MWWPAGLGNLTVKTLFAILTLFTDDHRYSFKGNKAALELDRFNRRLIKSVARLLLHEKKPESEVWKTLKRDTGCNCELLWWDTHASTDIEEAGASFHSRGSNASDLELVEPVVETIDLRQESDETLQGESNNDETLPRIVKVKQEPPDPDLEPQPQVEPKKSIYQEVLESTLKENQVIDAMLNSGYFDDYNDEEKDLEEVDLEEKEETMMPQITCVFSNVSESNLHNYSGTDKNTLAIGDGIDSDTSKLDNTDTVTNEVDVEPVTGDNQTRAVDVDGEIETVEDDVIKLDVAIEGNNVVEETKDVVEDDNVTDTVKIDSNTVTVQDRDGIVTIDEDDLTNADKRNDNNVTELVEENTQINKDDIVTEETPVVDLVAPISKGDNIIDNESVHEENLVQNENKNVEDGEETGSISKPVIITDSEDENSDAIVEPMDTALDYSATNIAENTVPEDTGDFKTTNEDIDCKANVKVEALKYSFGEIPNEFSFVDDGIELVDDGIAFEDYDDQIGE
ncbi:hypothetical protein HF086_012012 [Spodoptera exigua]|uniref:Uncharacterized protein n=1 Tax=Spodoptera exigua TaxID=7107 RepID=A0A922SHJ2_SPOEX|nr:hypothetical protein HF086_012012 [Spodoptera exigua]